MKNDPLFKLVAAIVIAGVIVAFASPGAPLHPLGHDQPEAATHLHQAE